MKFPKLPIKNIYEDVKSFSFLNDIMGLFQPKSDSSQTGGTQAPQPNNISLGGLSMTTIIVLVLVVSLIRK